MIKKYFTLTLFLLFEIIILEAVITSFISYNKASAQTGGIGITGENPKTVKIPAGIEVSPYKQMTIPIEIDKAAGIAGMDLDLRFNPSIIKPVDVECTSLTDNFLLIFRESGDGLLRISLVSHKGLTSGSGALISLIFEFLSHAIVYESTEIFVEKIKLYNENADHMRSIVQQNGQILIKRNRMNLPVS